MKSSGIIHVLIVVLFIVVIVGVAVNYKLYNDCMAKINLSEKQSKAIGDKVSAFEMSMDGLKLNIDSLKADLQMVSEKSLQPAELKNEFSAKIDVIRKDLQDIQVNYTTAIDDLNAKVAALKAENEANKKAQEKQAEAKKTEEKKVDLGEISVQTPSRSAL